MKRTKWFNAIVNTNKSTPFALLLSFVSFLFVQCEHPKQECILLEQAMQTIDSIYAKYGNANTPLLMENYPFVENYQASYVDHDGEEATKFAYLWPYSGVLSAVNVLVESKYNDEYLSFLNSKILPGIELYFDTVRTPYASYINTAPRSDRFYDDNIWIGIDFVDLFVATGDAKFLKKAKVVWEFVMSGYDSKLGGGIYWCEQKKKSKNTCSNAPAAVFALKLFEATSDEQYLVVGKSLYSWTKANLEDASDGLYFDNINLEGKVDSVKYSYNSGQMLQAASILYRITNDKTFLYDAQNLAKSCYDYFFYSAGKYADMPFRILKEGNVWFDVVMFRGFVELYKLDGNEVYIDEFRENAEYAWSNARDENGLFETDFAGIKKKDVKWLLTQASMAEMFVRLANLEE